MFEVSVNVPSTPIVNVVTTEGRGKTVEEVASRCAEKIVSVSDQAHPTLQAQARAFQSQIEKVVAFYMSEAIKSDRTTVYNAIKDAGHESLAEAIRRL